MASIPENVRVGRRGDLVVVGLFVATPLALVHWLYPPGERDLHRTAVTHELLVYPSVLVAGMVLCICWRMSKNPTTGWLAAGVTLVGAQGIGLAAVRVARPAAVADHSAWLSGVDLVVQALIVAVAVLAARRTLPVDPFAVGVAAGVLVTIARVALLQAPPAALDPVSLRAVAAAVFGGLLLTAALLVRLPRSPGWLRGRVAASIVLLGLSHLLISPTPVGAWGNGLAILTSLVGTALLVDTAFVLSQVLVQRQRSTVWGLHQQVEHLEADVRVDRARLHELGASLAGIANASHLLHTQPGLPPRRRRDLERTVDAEAARLQRLIDRRRVACPEESDLDSVLDPLVTTHRARGRGVRWEPSGIKALCCPDDVAEVVNILLENAAQHAGNGCALTVTRRSGAIEIRVSDRGPGIPPELAASLFVWGRRGPRSTGQGIGLHIAHRLMVEQGGDLRLGGDPGCRGTTFVATLPEPAAGWGDPDDDQPHDA